MADLTDWLARTFFISKDQEEAAAQAQAATQAVLDRERDQGKVGAVQYLQLTSQNQDTGAAYFDEQLGKGGLAGLPAAIPWWVYAVLIGAALIYAWPLLRPLVSRLTKRL